MTDDIDQSLLFLLLLLMALIAMLMMLAAIEQRMDEPPGDRTPAVRRWSRMVFHRQEGDEPPGPSHGRDE